jgi:hypothetical protein
MRLMSRISLMRLTGLMRPAGGIALGAVLLLLLGPLGACGPSAQSRPRAEDEWGLAETPREIDGDMDAAEARWRREIAAERSGDDERLLTDDPPAAPGAYGKVAFTEGADVGPPVPPTFWGRVKAGADTVGKASFAVLSVAVTLGMLVAPYLLL